MTEDVVKVLVVEDSEKHQAYIRQALTEEAVGITSSLGDRGLIFKPVLEENIEWATSRGEALEKLDPTQNPNYDLLILDLAIPAVNTSGGGAPAGFVYGFDVLNAVRGPEFPYYLPVIIFSQHLGMVEGYPDPALQHMLELLRCGVIVPPDEILSKAGVDRRDLDVFQRKLAPFLVDLDDADREALAEKAMITIPGRATRRVLRQLKRLARATPEGQPLPDVLLLGPNGVGKTTFGRAYHYLRRPPKKYRVKYRHEDLGALDSAGSSPALHLFGATDFNADAKSGQSGYALGAFAASTCYKINGKPTWFQNEQEYELADSKHLKELDEVDLSAQSDKIYYPVDSQNTVIDYESSGTLCLDEVVNISPAIQNMLLQAIGYNLRQRYVRTTGVRHWTVPVGPALVLATRKSIDEIGEEDTAANKWFGTLDYKYRIDQVRVEIPALAKRRDEVLPLLQELIAQRRSRDKIDLSKQRASAQLIRVDDTIAEMFADLKFTNNVADVRRIADQVTPEDNMITWRHIAQVFYRESRPPSLTSKDVLFVPWTRQQCNLYLYRVDTGAWNPLSLAEIGKKYHAECAFRAGLAFCENKGVEGTKTWPSERAIEETFGMKSGAFRQALKRLANDVSYEIDDVIADVAALREDRLCDYDQRRKKALESSTTAGA